MRRTQMLRTMRLNPALRRLQGDACAPRGFLAAGIAAGIKKSDTRDIAMIVSETPCCSAGVFTANSAKAAPVLLGLKMARHPVRGIVANSGNANACTGEEGLRNARHMSDLACNAVSGRGFSGGELPFFVCSTGRIGRQLPMQKIAAGIRRAAAALSAQDQNAAEAIMTTDTFAKRVAVEIRAGGKEVRIGGIAKGAGMIQPGMSPTGNRPPLHATMLCFLTTDVVMPSSALQRCLNAAVGRSFNRITVDGDMSTNDTVLLLANGRAGNRPLDLHSSGLRLFQEALNHVALQLALMIVRDGEGISKVVTLEVTGAASAADAEKAVRAIGNSILVKCSWCGEDPNWGRIYDAAGYSGARFRTSLFSVKYNGIPLVQNGLQIDENLARVRQMVKKPFFSIQCGLGLGKFSAILYTTDLTEEYVQLNKGE